MGQVARIAKRVFVFKLGTGHPHACARVCLSSGQVAHMYVCVCVFEIQLGTGRPHKCVRACVCLSLGQVARTLARACLSPGTGAHICARAGLRLSLGQVARRKNNVCVC